MQPLTSTFANDTRAAYNKKKYVWKLLYIYMLGYDVDFGHMEAVSLISSYKCVLPKNVRARETGTVEEPLADEPFSCRYSEKQVGYIVTAVLLREGHEFLRLVINTIRTDIAEGSEAFQCMALIAAANIGGEEFAEAMTEDVQKVLMSNFTRPVVKKKAVLCLLAFHKKIPELFPADEWSAIMLQLLEENHLGLLLCTTSLLLEFLTQKRAHRRFEGCVPSITRILQSLMDPQNVPHEFCYYGIPSPWLQVNCLRVLQKFPAPTQRSLKRSLLEVLQNIVMNTDIAKNDNKNNAAHAILFEGLALVMHLKLDNELMEHCVTLLGKFIAVRQANIRYLGLYNMARLCDSTEILEHIRLYQEQVVQNLRDPDISIRQKALDLMYIICCEDNAVDIIDQLLTYLEVADVALKEELTHKIAILAEKFAPTHKWYVDVMLILIDKASDFVVDEMWYHVVHVVTNKSDIQEYAAAECLQLIHSIPQHDMVIKAAGFVLGEFGHLLRQVSPYDILQALMDQFPYATSETKSILMCAAVKLMLRSNVPDPVLRRDVLELLEVQASSADAEIQQRAVELYELLKYEEGEEVLAQMPTFPPPLYPLLSHLVSAPQPPRTDVSEAKSSDSEGDSRGFAINLERERRSSRRTPRRENQEKGSTGEGRSNGSGREPLHRKKADDSKYQGESLRAQTSPVRQRANRKLHTTSEESNVQQGDPKAVPTTTQPSSTQQTFRSTTSTAPPTPSAPRPPMPEQEVNASTAVRAEDSLLMLDSPRPRTEEYKPIPGGPIQGDEVYGDLVTTETVNRGPPPAQAERPVYGRAQRGINSYRAPEQLQLKQVATELPDQSRNQQMVSTGPKATAPQLRSDLQQWYDRLLVSSSGVLYEDMYLQLGMKSEYNGCNGKAIFFFGNKHANELQQLQLVVEDMPALLMQELESCPHTIRPKQQLKYSLVFQCHAPFDTSPGITLAYSVDGTPVNVRLRFPVTVSKFMQPVQVAASEFFSRWKTVAGPPQKVQQVLQTAQAWSVQALEAMVQAFGLGVCPGLDPNPSNVVAAGNFLDSGNPVLCMVRIEVDAANPHHLRLTVASHNEILSPAMHDLLAKVGLQGHPQG